MDRIEEETLQFAKNNREIWMAFTNDCESLSLMPRPRSSDEKTLRYYLVFSAVFLTDFSEVERRGLDILRVVTIADAPFAYLICRVDYNRFSGEITFEDIPSKK